MVNNLLSKSMYRLDDYLNLCRLHSVFVLFMLLIMTACQVDKPLPQLEIEQGGTSSLGGEMNADSTSSAGGETILDTSGQQATNNDSMAGSMAGTESSSGGNATTSDDSNDSNTLDTNTPSTDDTADVECSTANPALTCLDTGCGEGNECADIGGCFPSSCSCEQGEWACTEDCSSGYECRPIEYSQLCGVRGTEECPEGTFCSYPPESQCGSLNVPGTCKPLDNSCSRIEAPVCGCDGVTYANECIALSTGISVQSVGECTTETCLNDADQDGICDEQDSECNLFGHGLTCLRTPPLCEPGHLGYLVVDGCYLGCMGSWDDCNPDRLHRLEAGDVCGNDIALCTDGTYCKFDEASMCGNADNSIGRCTPLGPSTCPQINDPVCGCDGRRYANACQAEAFGMSILQNGECSRIRCDVGSPQLSEICPLGMECRGDPNDECDPENGDTDCPQICIRTP